MQNRNVKGSFGEKFVQRVAHPSTIRHSEMPRGHGEEMPREGELALRGAKRELALRGAKRELS